MVERLGGEWLDADTMEKLVLALEYLPLPLALNPYCTWGKAFMSPTSGWCQPLKARMSIVLCNTSKLAPFQAKYSIYSPATNA